MSLIPPLHNAQVLRAFCPDEICVSPRVDTAWLPWAPVPVFDQPRSK